MLAISFLIDERSEYRHTEARSRLKRQRGTRKPGKVEVKIKSEYGQYKCIASVRKPTAIVDTRGEPWIKNGGGSSRHSPIKEHLRELKASVAEMGSNIEMDDKRGPKAERDDAAGWIHILQMESPVSKMYLYCLK